MSAPSKKIALITGCSAGGVGAAFASVFAANPNYHVYATARNTSKIPQSLHETSSVTVLALDVTSSESIAAAIEAVRAKTGERMDVLINNAGAGWNAPALDADIQEARRVFDANFFGPLEVVKAFGPMLVNAHGCCVNNCSVGGVAGFPFGSIYSASKAALINAGEVWRHELAPLNVRVLTLVTGGIATKFLENLQPVDLPEGSYYAGIKDIIEKQEENISFAQEPEIFAQDLLRRVEAGQRGKKWVAGGASLMKWVHWLAPQCVIDRIFTEFKSFQKKLSAQHQQRMAEESKKVA
ncbi:uncharacterized protein LTR77_001936 [Saxophila tyrrhenica]|uniref:NAD(P)-binding protein n=1 Tax=Saxophila tyrrhenica TaxID=1690608 RepID=A0AAV9PHS1_9PEZI|nr:hypothetical protein LTR77_001936 [Saxophila tyrrhenica]